MRQCSVIKSDVFKPCFSQVSYLPYYAKCVYDSCACDSGGDCECLCSAISAYAKECTAHGVPIKWRTNDLCRKYGLTSGFHFYFNPVQFLLSLAFSFSFLQYPILYNICLSLFISVCYLVSISVYSIGLCRLQLWCTFIFLFPWSKTCNKFV